MPTITERISERLHSTRSAEDSEVADHWQHTLDKFRVPDVAPECGSAQAWLICESPHTDEVTGDEIRERYPLRGRSGTAVTRALIECGHLEERRGRREDSVDYIPAGELVKRGILHSIKIVNVCELPLQSEPYARRIDQELIDCIPTTILFKEWAQILQALRTVRDLKVRSPAPTEQPLACDILADFRDRIENGEETCGRRFLLCGSTARACWRVLRLPNDRTHFVAHPSRGGWEKDEEAKARVRTGLRWLHQIGN